MLIWNAFVKLWQTTPTAVVLLGATRNPQPTGSHSLPAVSPGEVEELEIYSPESLLIEWIFGEGTFMLCSSKGASCAANLSTHRVFWGRGRLCNTHHALTRLPFHSSLEETSFSQGSLVQHHLRHEAQSWKARNYSACFKCPSLSESCQAQLYRTQGSLILKWAYILLQMGISYSKKENHKIFRFCYLILKALKQLPW